MKNMRYASVFKPGLFSGQVILITGGGTGIGRCTAHELASLGAVVALAGRTKEKLEKTAEEIRSAGGSAECLVCDIRDEEQVERMIRETLKIRGSLAAVVNNAGGQFRSTLLELSKNAWEAVIRNNLTGAFLVSREATRQHFSIGDQGGAIVNVLADFRNGMPSMGHSGAARAGVENFTKTASIEWAKFGVRINSIAPGIVESSGLASYDPAFMEGIRKDVSKIPAKRFATESEIAGAIVFLLSPAARYITGTLLPIDGGLSLRGHLTPLEDYAPHGAFNGLGDGSRPS